MTGTTRSVRREQSLSEIEPITQREFWEYRSDRVADLLQQVRNLLAHCHDERGITQNELALLLGKDKATVSKFLNGHHNFRIHTLLDVIYALDGDIDFDVRPVADFPPSNADAYAEADHILLFAEGTTGTTGTTITTLKHDEAHTNAQNLPQKQKSLIGQR